LSASETTALATATAAYRWGAVTVTTPMILSARCALMTLADLPHAAWRATQHPDIPLRERVQHGSGRVCGNLCYKAGKSRYLPCRSSRSLAETAVGGPQCAGDVHGHEKVPVCGQVQVPAGGQLKVPIPRFVVSAGIPGPGR
jgi:hypothetical protein